MNHFLVFLILAFSDMAIQCCVEARPSGFSIELIHRYSPMPPFFNHSTTHGEIALNDALRSIARSNHFLSSSFDESKIESQITTNGGDYLMKLSIGSPPVEALAVADTGSDLVWVQCEPCNQCYPQNLPIFNPVQSSSYMALSCDAKPCQALETSQCGNTNECAYSYGYGDELSRTIGVLSTDTITFDSTDGQVPAFPNTVFGCGNDNAGKFTGKESGIVGLGGGPLSLVSQLGDQIQHKFSYCLLPSTVNSASKLKFGTDALLDGTGVVSTPLLFKSPQTFYYLNLEAVSVGDQRIENGQTGSGEGNIIIDSGTTLNILETNFYNQIEALVQKTVGLESVQGPRGFKLCYDKNSLSTVSEFTMVFHFTGADVTLKRLNIFRELGGITCFAMVPRDGMSIYGNTAQINFQVGYDLQNKQVSFAPADCTKY